jgi:hypothetical protein
VTAIDQESADVVSLTMQRLHDEPLPEALPSQYVVLRFRPSVGDLPLFAATRFRDRPRRIAIGSA